MDIFNGLLTDEYFSEINRYIAIDRFTPETLENLDLEYSTFFLSHAHTDHTNGLFWPRGSTLLEVLSSNKNSYLFCTRATRLFLINMNPNANSNHIIYDKIRTIGYNDTVDLPPIEIDSATGSNLNIRVTCLQAPRHCKGACMFLFEYSKTTDPDRIRRSLYTGDFRIQNEEEARIIFPDRFKNPDGSLVPIHNLYLDTTFWFTPAAGEEVRQFPTQEYSTDLIVASIRKWQEEHRERNPNSELKILIVSPGRYNLADLFVRLYEEFDENPIYLYDEQEAASYNGDAVAEVQELERVAECVTPYRRDPENTTDDGFIHVCHLGERGVYEQLRNCHRDLERTGVVVKEIFPTVRRFLTTGGTERDDVNWTTGQKYRSVLYSTHSSFDEVQTFVRFVRPERIIVLEQKWEILEEQRQLIEEYNSEQFEQSSEPFLQQQQLNYVQEAPDQ